MEIEFRQGRIVFNKELTVLDEFVLSFTHVLNQQGIKYVIISGYVSILFGRSRTSEDVDIIFEKLDKERFYNLWEQLSMKYECINAGDAEDAFQTYLIRDTAIRFSCKGNFIPNLEVKFPKVELDEWVLSNRRQVIVNQQTLFISPLELQIPYKLFLGSEKDIEDARYLHQLFKEEIDKQLMQEFNEKLKTKKLFKKYLS